MLVLPFAGSESSLRVSLPSDSADSARRMLFKFDIELEGNIISKPSYYYDTIIRYYIIVIMCYNVL